MKPFLVSRDSARRREFISALPRPRVAFHGRHDLTPLADLFDKTYSLASLYRDESFFDALASVTSTTSLVIVDLGLDYHCPVPDYIKPYTKLKPPSLQAADVRIVDRLAFYYSRKSILRPFLYLHGSVFPETLQEFYGVGPYDGSTLSEIRSFVPRVRDSIELDVGEIPIIIERYSPTADEVAGYEALKQRVIMDERRPKAAVVNALFKYINATDSKRTAIATARLRRAGSLLIEDNDNRHMERTYFKITSQPEGTPVVFFDSGTFKLDMTSLETTLGAIRDHNRFVEVMRG